MTKHIFSLLALLCLSSQTLRAQSAVEQASLYSILINHPSQQLAEDITDAFLQIPTAEPFNCHDLSVKVINVNDKTLGKDARQSMDAWVEKNFVASRLVGRWFDRNATTGVCHLDLIKERSLYNPDSLEYLLTEGSERGQALLENLGEYLIGRTFLIINDITCSNRQQGTVLASTTFNSIGTLAGALLGNDVHAELSNGVDSTLLSLVPMYKGIRLNVRTYLYQLVWDEETAGDFYNDYWTSTPDHKKANLFEFNRERFHMKYIGEQFNDGSNVSFAGINVQRPQIMVRKACQRAIEENIARLQAEYPAFRSLTPLTPCEEGLTARIGRREGITDKAQYEVVRLAWQRNGTHSYQHVTTATPVKGKIWDNRFMAREEEAPGSQLGYTTFTIEPSTIPLTPDMFIRRVK